MVECLHESCERDDRILLPKNSDKFEDERVIGSNGLSDIAHHPWCIHCGCIKNISDDRPKKMGYWVNILSRIVGEFAITQSQKRLVVKTLESYDFFDDMYGATGSAQKDVFVKTVRKYCSIRENTIYSFIC